MGKLPASNPAQSATENRFGITRFATEAEATAGTSDDLTVSPKNFGAAVDASISSATTTVEGVGEISTDSEAIAKTVSTNKFLVPSNMAANGFIQFTDVSLTAVQIKLLATVPHELVPAPAAGEVILFLTALLKLVIGSEVLTETANTLAFRYTDGSGVIVSAPVECTAFIDAAVDTYTNANEALNNIVVATGIEGQALVLDNPGANFAGNASNDATLEVRTYFITQAI